MSLDLSRFAVSGLSGFMLCQGGKSLLHTPHENLVSKLSVLERTKMLMRRMEDFSFSNWRGLLSNCSSFARYLHTGEKAPLGSQKGEAGFYRWRKPLYAYKGGYIAVGDVVVVVYSNKHLLNYVTWGVVRAQNEICDTRLSLAEDSPSTLRYVGQTQRKKRSLNYMSVKDQIELVSSLNVDDYHFMVCIGYRDIAGVAEPVFVSQNGHNDIRKGKAVIEPPFGNIEIKTFDAYSSNEGGAPLAVFLSRPDTLPHPW